MDLVRCKQPGRRPIPLLHAVIRVVLFSMTCGLLIFALSGAAVAKYAVVIEDEATHTIVYTSESDPRTILNLGRVELEEHDAFEFSGFDGNEGTIKVKRASLLTVTADGKKQQLHVTDGTVQDALEQLHITVNPQDLINVSVCEPINSDMSVTINRVTEEVTEEVSTLPYSVREIPTQTLRKGKTRTVSEGKNGEMTTEVRRTYLDGRLTEETVLSETVTQKPVAAKVLVGDPNAVTSHLISEEEIELDENGNPLHYVKKVTGKATAYSALGKPTRLVPGCVAMNLSQYPRGTELYIKTPDGSYVYGYSEVRDTGPAVNEGIILVDLFFGSYRESCLFGAKTVDIYVLE